MPTEQTTAAAAAPEETGPHEDTAAPEKTVEFKTEVHMDMPKVEPETPAPAPPRGDGPNNKPQVR